MPIRFQIDPARRWLEMKLTGATTMEESAAAIDRWLSSPGLQSPK